MTTNTPRAGGQSKGLRDSQRAIDSLRAEIERRDKRKAAAVAKVKDLPAAVNTYDLARAIRELQDAVRAL